MPNPYADEARLLLAFASWIAALLVLARVLRVDDTYTRGLGELVRRIPGGGD